MPITLKAPAPPLKRYDHEVKRMEAWKAHFIARVHVSPLDLQVWAWQWAKDKSIIMPNERLEDGNADLFPQSKEALEMAGMAIKLNAAVPPSPEMRAAYTTAHTEDAIPWTWEAA